MPNTDSVAVDSPKESGHCLLEVGGSWLNTWLQDLECTVVMLPQVALQCPALSPTRGCEPGTRPEVQAKTNTSLNSGCSINVTFFFLFIYLKIRCLY